MLGKHYATLGITLSPDTDINYHRDSKGSLWERERGVGGGGDQVLF